MFVAQRSWLVGLLLVLSATLACQPGPQEPLPDVEDPSGSTLWAEGEISPQDAAQWSDAGLQRADVRSDGASEPLALWSIESVASPSGETLWQATLDDRLVAGEQLRDGTRVRLPHPDGRVLEGVVSSSMAHPIGTAGWIAHLEEDRGGRVVAAWAHNRWMFGYWVPGDDTRWTLVQEAGASFGWFEERDATDDFGCGGVVDVGNPVLAPPRDLAPGADDRLRAKSGGLHQIDVLIPYTEAAAAWSQANEASIEHTVTAAITLGNDAMSNSEIDARFRVLQLAPQTDEEGDPLDNVQDLRVVGNGFMDDVPPLRDAIGADLVAVFAVYESVGGLAFRPSGLPAPNAVWSVNRVQQLSWTYTLVHEMAHNMGSAHSRLQVQEPASAAGGLHPWSVGWYWQGPSGPESSVMAYAERDPNESTNWAQYGYFSNPDVVRNEPTGTDDATADGGPANNALSLNFAAPIVAAYRTALEVTVTVSGEGSADPDGTFFVAAGEDVEIALSPDEGWQLAEVLVNGDSVLLDNPLVVGNVQEDTDIGVFFRREQVIDFPPIPDRAFDDGPFTLIATASSGLPVSFAVASGLASIQDGELVPTTAGMVTVLAIQDGDASWMAAEPVARTFEVVGERADVILSDLEVDYTGAPQEPTVTTDPEGLDVEIEWEDREDAPTLPGSWPFTATITTAGFLGDASGVLVIRPVEALVTILEDEATFTGSPLEPVVETLPEELTVEFVWEGRDSAPTLPGAYPFEARVIDSIYAGEASGVFTILPAEATITLVQIERTYSGAPLEPEVETSPGGLSVEFEWEDRDSAPANTGLWPFEARVTQPGYVGTVEGVMTILPRPTTFSFSGMSPTFDDTPKAPTVTTSPASVPYALTWEDRDTAPTDPGEWPFSVQVTSTNHIGSRDGVLVIQPIGVTVNVSNLQRVYTGDVRLPTVQTIPPDIETELVWGTEGEAIQAGVYPFTVGVVQRGYAGQRTSQMTVTQATGDVLFADVQRFYDGTPQMPTITTLPLGLDYTLTWLDSDGPPVDVGNWRVSGVLQDRNYQGSNATIVQILKGPATVELQGLEQAYDGTPRVVTAITDPPDLQVEIRYNGSLNPPTNVNQYTIDAVVVDNRYQGSATGTLRVTRAPVTLDVLATEGVYNGSAQVPPFESTPAGVNVQVTRIGGSGPAVDAGTYRFRLQVVDANYEGVLETDYEILKAPATLIVDRDRVVFTGSPVEPSLSTSPVNLDYTVRFPGRDDPPVDSGIWPYIAEIEATNFAGSLEGELEIVPFPLTFAFQGLDQEYSGTPRSVQILGAPADATFEITYDGSPEPPIEVGTYAVRAVSTNPNYDGELTATLHVAPRPVIVVIENTSQVYNGEPRAVNVRTVPAGFATRVTYGSGESETPPVDAGSYAVSAAVSDPNGFGQATATLSVARRTLALGITDTVQVYDGTPRPVTITGAGDAAVTVRYNNLLTVPTNAGSYTVSASVNTTNETGSAQGTLVVSPMAVAISVEDLEWTYTGQAPNPTVVTDPAGVPTSRSWLPTGTAPTQVGEWPLRVEANSPNHTGATEVTVRIVPREVAWTFLDLEQTYDGGPREVEVESNPPGVPHRITYDGSTTRPRNVGTYTVFVESTSDNFSGSAEDTLTVLPRVATVTLQDLDQTWDGEPRPVRVTTVPAGLSVEITYDGAPEPPTRAGTFNVVATVQDANHTGTAEGVLRVRGLEASLSLGNLTQTYDGTPKPVTVNAALEDVDVIVTYDGASEPPVNVGTYEVIARYVSENIEGEARETLRINPMPVTLTLEGLVHPFTDEPVEVEVLGAPPGVDVIVTYDGDTTPPSATGTYTVRAVVDSPNHTGEVTGVLRIEGLSATVTLAGLEQTYDGAPKSISVTTEPSGLAVVITYDDAPDAPTDAGLYSVRAEISDPNYSGFAVGAFRVLPAQASVSLVGLERTYNGEPATVAAVVTPEDLPVEVTYDGGTLPPEDAGTYQVRAVVTDPNWEGEVEDALVIAPADATVVLEELLQEANGSRRRVTAVTTPAGLDTRVLYEGETQAPVAVGSYAVVAEVIDPNWRGETSGELVVVCPETPCVDGERTCDAEGRRVVTCRMASWGCLETTSQQPCSSQEQCVDGACQLLCEDACSLGQRSCVEGRPAACGLGPSGCLQWQPESACSGDRICTDGQCVLDCRTACTVGERSCEGGTPMRCVSGDAQRCPTFQAMNECAEGFVCDAGQCVLDCTTCEPGSERCSDDGNAVERCEEVTESCLRWEEATVCGRGERCDDAACVSVNQDGDATGPGPTDPADATEETPPDSGGSSSSGCAAAGGGGSSHASWAGLLLLLAWRQRRHAYPRAA